MSTIQQVRAAQKKLEDLAKALRNAGANDPFNLTAQVREATDEYAKVVRELDSDSIQRIK